MNIPIFCLTHRTIDLGSRRTVFAMLVALLCAFGHGEIARADGPPPVIVTFVNGDRVSGRVVSVTAEQLQIETPYAGKISIRIAAIKDWQAADDKLRQRLGAFLPLKDKARFVEAKKARSQPPPPQVTKPEPWQRTVNFAYALARGNVNLSDLNLAFSLSRKYGSHRFAFSSFGRYGVRNGAEIADLLSGVMRYERTVAKLPAFTETSFEIDRIKRLDHRLTENIGLIYPVLKGEGPTLSFDFGTGLTQEVYSTGLRRTTASSLLRATAAQKLNGKAQFNEQVTLFSDLFNPAGYRLQTDVSFTMPITKHVALRLTGLNRFDHRPPPLVKRNDFSLLTGLSFTF